MTVANVTFKDGASYCRGIFAQLMTMREKRGLARAIGIQNENGGYNQAFVRDNL